MKKTIVTRKKENDAVRLCGETGIPAASMESSAFSRHRKKFFLNDFACTGGVTVKKTRVQDTLTPNTRVG